MSEHLRHLSKQSTVPVACMPNAGLPVLDRRRRALPALSPAELATAHEQFVREFGLGLVGGCCGTTPEHLAAVVERLRPSAVRRVASGASRDMHAASHRGRSRRREPLPARALRAGASVPRDR